MIWVHTCPQCTRWTHDKLDNARSAQKLSHVVDFFCVVNEKFKLSPLEFDTSWAARCDVKFYQKPETTQMGSKNYLENKKPQISHFLMLFRKFSNNFIPALCEGKLNSDLRSSSTEKLITKFSVPISQFSVFPSPLYASDIDKILYLQFSKDHFRKIGIFPIKKSVGIARGWRRRSNRGELMGEKKTLEN